MQGKGLADLVLNFVSIKVLFSASRAISWSSSWALEVFGATVFAAYIFGFTTDATLGRPVPEMPDISPVLILGGREWVGETLFIGGLHEGELLTISFAC